MKDYNNCLLLMYHYIISTSSIQMKSKMVQRKIKQLQTPNKMKPMIKKKKTKKTKQIMFNIENKIFK